MVLVYLGDRNNARIQVFEKDGTFVKEALVRPTTARGSVLDFVFSRDPDQTFVFVADGRNERVWILRRSDLQMIGEFRPTPATGEVALPSPTTSGSIPAAIYTSPRVSKGNVCSDSSTRDSAPRSTDYDEYGIRLD